MEIKNKESKDEERLVRILSTDINGNVKLYTGLTKIKGVSWSISNIVCKNLKMSKDKKIGSLNQKEIDEISKEIKNLKAPNYILNRRKDFESGENKHLVTTDLDLQKEFDIKRLKKIKSYRGSRHLYGQPSRGQRTKSHFRTNRKRGVGIKRKTVAQKPTQYKKEK